MSEHEPSVHAMRAAEVIENEYDLSNGAAEYLDGEWLRKLTSELPEKP